MTKREYLEKLARGLRPLPKEERRRQLDYYEEMLSDRLDEGLDEADAVAAMDPPETVIDRVLRDYTASGRPLRRHHVGLWIGLGAALMVGLLTAAVLLVGRMDRESGSTWQFPIFQQDAGDSASTSASASLDLPYHAEYTVPADGVTGLDLSWTRGDVTVQPWNGDSILLEEDSEVELTEDYRLLYTVEDGELKLRFDGQPSRDVTWRKVLTVRLPEALAQSLAELDAATVSAHVTVLDLTAAELDIETVSGGVYARGGFPQTDVSTTSGSAYLSGTFGELDFSTVSGDMTLETNETFRLDAETTSGSVCLRLPEDMGLTWTSPAPPATSGPRARTTPSRGRRAASPWATGPASPTSPPPVAASSSIDLIPRGLRPPGDFFPSRRKNSEKTMDICPGIVYTAIKHQNH